MRKAVTIKLTPEQHRQRQSWTRSATIPVRLARRARIVLLAFEGLSNEQIAVRLDLGRIQVGRWRSRFSAEGIAGSENDFPGRG